MINYITSQKISNLISDSIFNYDVCLQERCQKFSIVIKMCVYC